MSETNTSEMLPSLATLLPELETARYLSALAECVYESLMRLKTSDTQVTVALVRVAASTFGEHDRLPPGKRQPQRCPRSEIAAIGAM
jgi:hypothetical protein